METAFVTGATGFLGARVVRELTEHGYRVVANGRDPRRMPPEASSTVLADLEELGVATWGVRADVVVHCAALSSAWGPWDAFERANVHGTAAAYRAASRMGARRFVHISSPSIYAQRGDRFGIREDDVEEGNRLNAYIRSKIAAERVLREAAGAADGPDVVVLRPRGLIGAGDPSLAPRLLQAHARIGIPLLRGGRALTDLTPVASAARAVRLALAVPGAAGGVFNVTGGDPRPFRALAERLLDVLGLPHRFRALPTGAAYAAGAVLERAFAAVPGRPEPPLTRYTVTTLAYAQTLDITRARTVLGYEPGASIEDALEEYARG